MWQNILGEITGKIGFAIALNFGYNYYSFRINFSVPYNFHP